MMRAPDPDRLGHGDASLDCFVVPWDTESFGFPVAQIARINVGNEEATAETLREFDDWCAARGVRLVSCRLDRRQLRESMALEESGFRFVEMVYVPRLESLAQVEHPEVALDVTDATAADLGTIEQMAASVFATGRFRLDWRLSPEGSDRRYADWVRNSFQGPEHRVLKAERDGEIIGFFVTERRHDGGVYWHLTAIGQAWQGQGLGLSLWRTMLLRHKAERATYVETTISGHNVPAMNLYARLGFAFTTPQMTFHRLIDPPG